MIIFCPICKLNECFLTEPIYISALVMSTVQILQKLNYFGDWIHGRSFLEPWRQQEMFPKMEWVLFLYHRVVGEKKGETPRKMPL